MKPLVIISIAVGISVVAVLGVLVGIGVYQQTQLEKEQKEANQSFIDQLQKVAKSEQKQPTTPTEPIKETEKPQEQINTSPPPAKSIPSLPSQDCSGSSGCFSDYVTRIIDGDTIYTDTLKIRLSLTNTPEINQVGYSQATLFTEMLCPVGSRILVDQDDLQPVDKYSRVLAKVYCGDKVLNSELLYNGYANILTQYCSSSEFAGEVWAQTFGCGIKKIQPLTPSTQTKENNCDPSYPDFCIPPPPPDLDCKDIPQKRFTVLPPDPHRFDGDKDGIGCEN